MTKQRHNLYRVEVSDDNGVLVHSFAPTSMQRAVKIKRGVDINLNHDRYTARVKAFDGEADDKCRWCGSSEQHTDAAGTCVRCKLPWQHSKWLPHHAERYEAWLDGEAGR